MSQKLVWDGTYDLPVIHLWREHSKWGENPVCGRAVYENHHPQFKEVTETEAVMQVTCCFCRGTRLHVDMTLRELNRLREQIERMTMLAVEIQREGTA